MRLGVAWTAVATPARLPWAIDCLELLAGPAVQRRADVVSFVTGVVADFAAWHPRTQPEWWPLRRRACDGLERPDLFHDPRPPGSATTAPAAGTPLDGK